MENDLISRQAAIDAIERHLHIVLDGTHYDEGIAFGYEAAHRHIIDVIHDLSSAQRKGKWIATQEWGGRNYSCSCCKFSFIVDTCMLEPMWNFCPNCGAEMKGEEDE